MKIKHFKITGPVSIKGFVPGQTFTLKVDDNGVPIEAFWRARVKDEEEHKLGHLKELKKVKEGEEPAQFEESEKPAQPAGTEKREQSEPPEQENPAQEKPAADKSSKGARK